MGDSQAVNPRVARDRPFPSSQIHCVSRVLMAASASAVRLRRKAGVVATCSRASAAILTAMFALPRQATACLSQRRARLWHMCLVFPDSR